MATLILGSVGTALGGPVGGAIGSLIGQSIDQMIFAPPVRQGPRLGDLSVQTSTYGAAVPRVYGTMRVAGSVVWATELSENAEPQEGAKGQPEVITYSYSASFAVALSSRRAISVKRIWADGKLLRGEAGDFKVKCGFRFYPGDEDQPVDPLIASVEGIAQTPAYRGLALAVFEDLQLADYGNRIPFITFEVEADQGEVAIGELLADCTGGVLQAETGVAVIGYAAHGTDVASAIRPLIDQSGIWLGDDGEFLRIGNAFATVTDDELGCSADGSLSRSVEKTQVAARALPARVTIAYYDRDRDYQTSQAQAQGSVASGVRDSIELPAVLDAAAAKGLAESSLARRWAERDRYTLRLPPAFMDLAVGSTVEVPGLAGPCVAATVRVDSMVAVVEARPRWDRVQDLSADPGRPLTSPDVVAGPTRLALLDVPDLGNESGPAPALLVAAASPTGTWAPVPLQIVSGGVASAGRSALREAVMGTVTALSLAPGQSAMFDLVSSIEIELANEEMWPQSRDDDALANGANMAAVGDELVQFGLVEPLGGARFRLSRLLRGRRGTEWAMGAHEPGEVFVLLAPASVQRIALPPGSVGSAVEVRAYGIGDGDGVATVRTVTGERLRPPSPVDVRASLAGATLRVNWTRRSRFGWTWSDGIDAPIGESREAYRVRAEASRGSVEIETAEPAAVFDAADVGSGPVDVTVWQIGDFALSRPATISITL